MRIIRPIAAVVAIALVGALSFGRLAAEEAAQPKPYKPVAIELPQPVKDPSFAAFRQQLADIAKRKDRAALAKHVAANFFWQTDDGKDIALQGRPGIDNLVRALYLDNPETEGWDILAAFAADATGDPSPERKGVICAPGEPKLDGAAAASARRRDRHHVGVLVLPEQSRPRSARRRRARSQGHRQARHASGLGLSRRVAGGRGLQ